MTCIPLWELAVFPMLLKTLMELNFIIQGTGYR
jgi:hypothetical protein